MRPIAVTTGEPSGIGPDIILSSWTERERLGLPKFFVLGDPHQLKARAYALGLDVAINEVAPEAAHAAFATALPVVPLRNRLTESAGQPNADNAAGVIEAIDRAVEDVFSGSASAIVTAPIAKKPLYDAGFSHPGHTEYLAELAAKYTDHEPTPVMMIAGPKLRTIPVTIHIPLHEVPLRLTREAIVETVKIADHDLRMRFGIEKPRIAVSGLNPHAGENGAMGSEDSQIIVPAIADLVALGVNAFGPLPADTMFHDAARQRYDVAVCMYHDQALIPAKAIGFDDGVNVTLGLPFIRTSPDHGTAFDIAGKGIAKPDSFTAALKLAAQMAEAETNG